jgi:hypothetical protein
LLEIEPRFLGLPARIQFIYWLIFLLQQVNHFGQKSRHETYALNEQPV